ncbi:MAG: hypothetical protein DMG30_02760 [Acidobacteria bacterium]|nr:MAG: hypothetical protein DMG30_02760 [Acidobacteriota bacterium]
MSGVCCLGWAQVCPLGHRPSVLPRSFLHEGVRLIEQSIECDPKLRKHRARSLALTATTVSIMAFGMWRPYSPLASALGFTHLPRMYWPILMLTLLSYVGLTKILKLWLLRRHWI